MGHYDDCYEEAAREHEKQMKKQGYIRVPDYLQKIVGSGGWAMPEEIEQARRDILGDKFYDFLMRNTKRLG